MRQLCEMFTHHAFIPGINIVNDGFIEKEETDDGIEAVGTMFLIYKGRVAGYGKNSTGRDFLVETLYPGQLFGAYSVLFYDMPYNMVKSHSALDQFHGAHCVYFITITVISS